MTLELTRANRAIGRNVVDTSLLLKASDSSCRLIQGDGVDVKYVPRRPRGRRGGGPGKGGVGVEG